MNLNINDFQGPLDLLLHMVKKHEMDIYEIDIKIIIDEYIEFINSLDRNDLDSKSEYLIMASELIHLKSKLLLGFDDEENDEVYEINSEEKCIEDIINNYIKERLNVKKAEIINSINNENLSKDKMKELEEELSLIIIKLAKMK